MTPPIPYLFAHACGRKLAVLLLTLITVACTTPPPPGIHLSQRPAVVEAPGGPAATQSPQAYRLQVNDEVDIRFLGLPALDQTVRLGPDGRVVVPHLRPVHALDRTLEEVTRELQLAIRDLTPGGANAVGQYVLRPGDEIEVRFLHHPQLTQAQRLRPDGRISLQLVKTVQAEGLTPEALEADLQERYSAYLKQPDLTVVVRNFDLASATVRVNGNTLPAGLAHAQPVALLRSFATPQVFVAGEVNRPGMLNFRRRMTLLQAIVESGSHKPSGELRSVLVLRKSGQGEPLTIRRNVLADLTTLRTQDMELQPGDIVILPKTSVASTAEAIDQYVYQLLAPLRNSSFGFVYDIRRPTN